MTHSKESGANVGPSGRDVVSLVSCLSLILSADSALEIPTLVPVGLNKRVETNVTFAGQPMWQRAAHGALEEWWERGAQSNLGARRPQLWP